VIRRANIGIFGAAIVALALQPSLAVAQQKTLKDQLVGVWTLVTVDNVAPDGSKRELFGPKPKGTLILDASGRYAQVQVHPDRPRFKANNRLNGTPEENKAVIAGAYASSGTWSIDEADKSLTRIFEASATFPNEEGKASKWSITLTGDELTALLPTPSAGGKTTLVWRRVK
jgi:hypothetical protein